MIPSAAVHTRNDVIATVGLTESVITLVSSLARGVSIAATAVVALVAAALDRGAATHLPAPSTDRIPAQCTSVRAPSAVWTREMAS